MELGKCGCHEQGHLKDELCAHGAQLRGDILAARGGRVRQQHAQRVHHAALHLRSHGGPDNLFKFSGIKIFLFSLNNLI